MNYALYNTVMHYNALLFFTVLCYFELVLVCTIVPEVGVSLLPLVAGLPEISVTRSCGLRGGDPGWTQAGEVCDLQPVEGLLDLRLIKTDSGLARSGSKHGVSGM